MVRSFSRVFPALVILGLLFRSQTSLSLKILSATVENRAFTVPVDLHDAFYFSYSYLNDMATVFRRSMGVRLIRSLFTKSLLMGKYICDLLTEPFRKSAATIVLLVKTVIRQVQKILTAQTLPLLKTTPDQMLLCFQLFLKPV